MLGGGLTWVAVGLVLCLIPRVWAFRADRVSVPTGEGGGCADAPTGEGGGYSDIPTGEGAGHADGLTDGEGGGHADAQTLTPEPNPQSSLHPKP